MIRRKTKEEFILDCKEIHGDKYDYSMVEYINSYTKVKIICNKHGMFEQKPNSHFNNGGCYKCGQDKKRYTREEFIINANKKHNGKYDYSESEYINITTKIKIKCNQHGYFWQLPGVHIRGKGGCIVCNVHNIQKSDKDTFIEKANTLYKNLYKYDDVEYINARTMVKIICDKHGEFHKTPNHHLNGQGCPKCGKRISKHELVWLDSLGVKLRQHKIYIDNNLYLVDGYDPDSNTIYEFNGDYWHGNPKKYNPDDLNKSTGLKFGELYNKTIERENKIIESGYNLVSMWESDFLLTHVKSLS